MTVAAPEAPPSTPVSPRTAAVEATISAYEARAVTAALGALTDTVEGITQALAQAAGTPRYAAALRAAADALASLRPQVALRLTAVTPMGARIGAKQAGAALPDQWRADRDPNLRRILRPLDGSLRAAARESARDLRSGTPTPQQAARIVERVQRRAHAAAVNATHTAVASGFTSAADAAGRSRMWVSERTGCLACLAYSGQVAEPGAGYFPVSGISGRSFPWVSRDAGIPGPPLHPGCRCHQELPTPGLSVGLAREARRSVARGWSEYDSLPARLEAVDRLLTSGAQLPRTVEERAARDLRRGSFSNRHVPRTPYRSGRQ